MNIVKKLWSGIMSKILITGVTGFIGSAFLKRYANLHPESTVVGLCRSDFTRNFSRIKTFLEHYPNVLLVYGDMTQDISGICEGITHVFNFAAKTFVDHSIRDAKPFIDTNFTGTYKLLEDARKHKVERFYQISTDEVYGQILQGAYKEDAPLNPRNPYAAAKAAADCLVQSYAHTYGMHVTVTRTENNYGEYQDPQKAIPTFIRHAIADKPLPVYGDGKHVRQWLNVHDHVYALLFLMNKQYESGQIFHVAGNQELTNIELAQKILTFCQKPNDMIKFIDDHNIRPGHDRRYALDCSKMNQMGWKAKIPLDMGLEDTVDWYIDNPEWLR